MDAALKQVLLAPWHQRNRERPWLRRVLLALGLLLLAGGSAVSLFTGELSLLAGLWVLALACTWGAVADSLLQQNHPHAARFVPGHLRRLRKAALLGWGASSLGCALLLHACTDLPFSFALLLLITAGTGFYIAWGLRWWPAWVLIWLVPAAGGLLGVRNFWPEARALWAGQPEALTVLGLIGLAAGLWALFGDGSARHGAHYKQRAVMRQAMRDGMAGQRTDAAAFGRGWQLFNTPVNAATAAWLHRLGRRARPTEANVMARADVVLYGPQHWVRHLVGIVMALCLVALTFTIVALWVNRPMPAFWVQGGFGMAIGLASAGFNPLFMAPGMLWQSRREQALLCLLPGMPQGVRLNRLIARRQAVQAGVVWVVTTGLMAGLSRLSGDTHFLALSAAALPWLVLRLWQPPARLRAATGWAAAWPVMGYFVTAIGLSVIARLGGLPLAVLMAGCAVLALALGVWRWRQLVGAPAALPAGRV